MTKKKKAKAQKAAEHEKAVEDIIAHFDTTYISSGTARSLLSAMQDLCEDLDVEVGTSLKKCKINIKNAYVNIHDFVRVRKQGGDVSKIKFSSYGALRRDIGNSPSRRFPLWRAKGHKLLEAMLINV